MEAKIGNREMIRTDYLETVSEEINLMMGLRATVVKGCIEVETIAGIMKFETGFGELMQDVYRFVYCYGSKLHNYGIKKRLELDKQQA